MPDHQDWKKLIAEVDALVKGGMSTKEATKAKNVSLNYYYYKKAVLKGKRKPLAVKKKKKKAKRAPREADEFARLLATPAPKTKGRITGVLLFGTADDVADTIKKFKDGER